MGIGSVFGEKLGGGYMKISVCYNHILLASEQSGLPLSEVLKRIKNMGIEFIGCSYEELALYTQQMKLLLRVAGLGISFIYQHFDFGYKDKGEEGYKLIDLAEKMGAKYVLVIPGLLKKSSSVKKEEAIEHMVQALKLMCNYAKKKNIIVTLEDYDNANAPYSTTEEILWFMQQVPDLKHTFDTGNYIYRGEDEVEALQLLKDYVVQVHVKDRTTSMQREEVPKLTADGTPLFAAPVGAGIIKMKEIIEVLKDMKYDGVLNIEHFDAKNQMGYIEQSAKWLVNNVRIN